MAPQIHPSHAFAIIIKTNSDEPELLQSFPPKDVDGSIQVEQSYKDLAKAISKWGSTVFRSTQLHPAVIEYRQNGQWELVRYL
jgi:hypothetical protein